MSQQERCPTGVVTIRNRVTEKQAIRNDGTPKGTQRIVDWMNGFNSKFDPNDSDTWTCSAYYGDITIRTLEGDHLASKGDWVIRGIAGEFYPCKPDIFEKSYEIVGHDSAPSSHNNDDYVAWLRYKHHPNGDTSIHVCDSDAEGAFKVYRQTTPSSVAPTEFDKECVRCGAKVRTAWTTCHRCHKPLCSLSCEEWHLEKDACWQGSVAEQPQPKFRDPTERELESPMFNAIWDAIKGWDISRTSNGLYSGATGTDVCIILDALNKAEQPSREQATSSGEDGSTGIRPLSTGSVECSPDSSREQAVEGLVEALRRSLGTIAFFSSVIKCGERWSITCQDSLEQMHKDIEMLAHYEASRGERQ